MTEITTTLYTAEASELHKKSQSQVHISDPLPEIAIAAIEKNVIATTKKSKNLVSDEKSAVT